MQRFKEFLGEAEMGYGHKHGKMKSMHGGVQKKSRGMGKEMGSKHVGSYPHSDSTGSSLHAHALESKHRDCNTNQDGGDALGPLKHVSDYHEHT